MQLDDALQYAFDRVGELVRDSVEDLEPAALTWRPDPHGNTIAWLICHLTRVQDEHVAEITGRHQVWSSEGWAQRCGLAPDAMDTGDGHSPDRVATVEPADPEVLLEYHDRVAEVTEGYLAGADLDFERVIDASYDPPVTVGVRLLSVLIDAIQHAGQAAYVRGMWERRQGQTSSTAASELPDELRSRVLAATAHAEHRRVEFVPEGELPVWVVEAVSGDRLVLMRLALRADGSVDESTQTVTADQVVELHRGEEHVELLVDEAGGTRRLIVSPPAVAALLPEPA
jgi:hypothetical protein